MQQSQGTIYPHVKPPSAKVRYQTNPKRNVRNLSQDSGRKSQVFGKAIQSDFPV